MKINMGYFKSKIKALREEYTEADKVEIVRSHGGKCQLCNAKEGDTYIFGPTHYIKKRVKFKVHIHIHKIKSHGDVHKVVICDGCHLSYHLFNRLDVDAQFGNRTIKHIEVPRRKVVRPRKVLGKVLRRAKR